MASIFQSGQMASLDYGQCCFDGPSGELPSIECCNIMHAHGPKFKSTVLLSREELARVEMHGAARRYVSLLTQVESRRAELRKLPKWIPHRVIGLYRIKLFCLRSNFIRVRFQSDWGVWRLWAPFRLWRKRIRFQVRYDRRI